MPGQDVSAREDLDRHPARVGRAPRCARARGGEDGALLPESAALVEHPEGKRAVADQLQGRSDEDGLGTRLPAGISREAILEVVLPDRSVPITLVGARPWKALPGGFVAIACVSRQARVCEDGPAWLAVLQLRSGRLALVARTAGPVPMASEWGSLPEMQRPVQLTIDERLDDPPGIVDDQIVRFDLAPFALSARETAVGLRTAFHEGYAGGFGYFESLRLFRIVGDRLVQVLVHPIYVMTNSAGSWNEDGTRDHHVSEHRLVLRVERTRTGGIHDLAIQPTGRRAPRFVARWNGERGRYDVVER